MNHRQHSGYTLLELILAMAIFAIIAVGFFGMFSTIYTNNYLSSVATENVYLAQDQLENKISDVKVALDQGTAPSGYTTNTITLFSGTNQRTVVVYHITQENETGRTLESYIASVRPPELFAPTITSDVSIGVYSGTTLKTFPNIAMDNISVQLTTALTVDNPGKLIRYLYYWYVSKPGQYVLNSPPTFPDDYEIVTNVTGNEITTIPADYAGRFLKLVITPVGEKGKMGTSVESNALYISPLPVNTSLLLHLDASYVNSDDTNQIRISTSGGNVYKYIKKWIDISNNATPLDLTQTTTTYQPVLGQFSVGTEDTEHILLGSLGISGVSGQTMKSATTGVSAQLNITLYFAAFIEDGFPANTILFQSKATAGGANRFIVKTNASGKLQVIRYLSTTSASNTWTLDSSGVTYNPGEWNIFKIELFSNRLALEINGQDAGSMSYTATTQTMTFVDFEVKFDYRLTMGEMLVYGAQQAQGSTEAVSLLSYLNSKFKP